MWFLIALVVVSFVVGLLIPSKVKTENAKSQGLDQFNAPRSKEGDPVPKFWGTVLLNSPNTVALHGYTAKPIKQKQKTGIFSSKKVTVGFQYFATLDLVWALGPGVIFRRIYFGKSQVWAGCLYDKPSSNIININLPELYGKDKTSRGGISGTIAAYGGSFEQDADAYLVSNLSPKYPAYVGVAHMVFRNFYWGNSAGIDAVSVEASFLPKRLLGDDPDCAFMMSNGLDANPVEVLYDIFLEEWGALGYSSDRINFDMWKGIARVIFDEGNGISLQVTSSSDAKDIFRTILRQINAIIYENQVNGGLVEIKLLRNDYEIEDLPVLTPSEIVEVRNYTKKLWSETNNVVRVKYTSRAENYAKDKVAQEKDSSLLRFQGKESPIEIAMPGVMTAELAQAIAARELSNLNIPLFSAEFTLNRIVSGMMPGAAFVWHWPEYNIEQIVMRVRKIGLGTLEDGKITFTAIQDEFAVDATVIAPPANSEYVPADYEPQKITLWKLFELPYWLAYNAGLEMRAGYTRLAAFVNAPSSYTNGFDAYVVDTSEDVEVLDLSPYAVRGKLASNVGRFDGFLTGSFASLIVKDMSSSDLLDPGGTPRMGGGMIMIGDELLNYESYAANNDGTFTLNNIHRALLDTGWFAHSIDDQVYFFEGQENFFESDTLNGDTDTIYFLDNTATGSGQKAGATLINYQNVSRIERPIAPDYVTANGSRTPNQIFNQNSSITLNARSRNRFSTTEVWFEDDAAVTAENGTLYRIMFEKDGVPTLIADDVALPYVWETGAVEGTGVVLIYAKRDGLLSYAAAPMPMAIGSGWGYNWDGDWSGDNTMPGSTAEFSQAMTRSFALPEQQTITVASPSTFNFTSQWFDYEGATDTAISAFAWAVVDGAYDLTFAVSGIVDSYSIMVTVARVSNLELPMYSAVEVGPTLNLPSSDHLIFDTNELPAGEGTWVVLVSNTRAMNTASAPEALSFVVT